MTLITNSVLGECKLPVAKVPCKECPFRKTSLRGWLGGQTALDYLEEAHSNADIACHMSPGYQSWNLDLMRSCAGLAIYRRNVCKIPKGGKPREAYNAHEKNTELVFATPQEFSDYHSWAEKKLIITS